MKENKISVEEVEFCLQELEESIESQKQVDKALGTLSLPSFFSCSGFKSFYVVADAKQLGI